MVKLSLIGEEKKSSGTGCSRALRRAGKIPAVVYGFNRSYKLSLIYRDFLKEYVKGNVLSRLINIVLGQNKLVVIPREVQIDPVTDNPIHVDFQLVKDDVPVKVGILVKAINQEKSPGIKRGGILNIVRQYVDFHCMPKNIPTFLGIDVSGFEIGQNIHINDIKLPIGVTPINKDNFTVLTIAGRESGEKEEEQVQEDNNNDSKEQKEEGK